MLCIDQMLTIGVTQPHHAGYYQCVASNRLGVTYATAYVEVTDKNSRPAPLPVQPPQPKTPAGGSTSQQKDKQGIDDGHSYNDGCAFLLIDLLAEEFVSYISWLICY